MQAGDGEADPAGALLGRRPQDHSVQPYSAAGVEQALALAVRPTDIFVTTAPKTGTTWLTQVLSPASRCVRGFLSAVVVCVADQVLHQLRTGGDMEFDDIYQVVPWPPLCYDLGMDCNMDQKAFPRVFKTHQRLSAVNPGGKYLCTVRDPVKTMISWWNFLGPVSGFHASHPHTRVAYVARLRSPHPDGNAGRQKYSSSAALRQRVGFRIRRWVRR